MGTIFNMVKLRKSKDKESFYTIDLSESSVKSIFLKKAESGYSAEGVSIRQHSDKSISNQDIKETIKECNSQSGINANEAIVGLSGSKTLAFILLTKSERPDPTKEITSKEMDEIYAKVQETAGDQASQRWSTFFADNTELEPLDLVVNSVHVDDNLLENPVGAIGKYIYITAFCSFVEKNYYHGVLSSLKKAKLNPLAVTTSSYSQVKVISEKHKNFILVDIGRDSTDVSVIFGKNIIQNKTFDIGGSYFSKCVSESLGVDREVASGKKVGYAQGTLNDQEVDTVGDLLYEAAIDWRAALSSTLLSMSGIKSFPQVIYLSGGGANLPVIEEVIYEEAWRQPVPFAGEINIVIAGSGLWQEKFTDRLNVLSGPQIFVPISLATIKLELEQEDAET